MTRELVGPVPTIRFHDGTKIAYQVPRDTLDPRYTPCAEHHPACDCREAEMAEQIAELRGELKAVADAAREVLAGHPVWVYEDGPNGQRAVGCACTGCQIVRASWVLPHSFGDSMARDSVDGIDPDSLDAGRRWRVCAEVRCPSIDEESTRRPGELGFVTRDRGHYHEHLHYGSGELVRAYDPDWCPF